MAAYRLTTPVALDYVEILDNALEGWGEEQFEHYGELLETTFLKLVKTPQLGRHFEGTPEGCMGYRIGSHVVFYRIGSKGIEIIRILHKNMDFKRHLSN